MRDSESENVFSDKDGNDIFRWDLEGYDKFYVYDLLDGFLEGSSGHGRKLAEIRMRQVLFDRLDVQQTGVEAFYKGVPITICDTGFDDTLEVILAPMN